MIETKVESNITTFSIESADLKNGQAIPKTYYGNLFGYSEKNESPALSWKNIPNGTRSFAITFYDKDAPTGSGFWHYLAYDIPILIHEFKHNDLSQGKLPAGAKEGNTDLGKPGFFGPCPPPGRIHRYFWTVYALSVDTLPVDSNATSAVIGFYLWQHTLAKASFEVTGGTQ